jgi:type 1 glutamine amidotransferase
MVIHHVRHAERDDYYVKTLTMSNKMLSLIFAGVVALSASAKENLQRFVRDGKGLVVIHYASGAFENWPEFRNLVGRTQRKKHDKRGPFTVVIANHDHPVTRGLKDFETDDELFIELQGDRPIEVLATAHSKITDKDHPMAFVLDYGKGRVFHTTLGHDAKALRLPGPSELIRRGAAWASGRELGVSSTASKH